MVQNYQNLSSGFLVPSPFPATAFAADAVHLESRTPIKQLLYPPYLKYFLKLKLFQLKQRLMPTLWVAGRWEDVGPWQVLGVYSSEQKALDAVREDGCRFDFIGPLKLNDTELMNIEWPGVYYPYDVFGGEFFND